jgi:nitrogen regulatory protein PII 1
MTTNDRQILSVVRCLNHNKSHLKKRKIMYLLRAIVRPEKSSIVMKALFDAGFPAVTKLSVFGRGKQRGIKVGNVTYDELPKDLLMIVIPEKDKDFVIETIVLAARSGEKGQFGDGKIFVTPVEESYTISSGKKD